MRWSQVICAKVVVPLDLMGRRRRDARVVEVACVRAGKIPATGILLRGNFARRDTAPSAAGVAGGA